MLATLQKYLPVAKDVAVVLKDLATAGAAIVAAIVAWNGLQTWSKELRGKTEYKLARRLLRSVYRARNSLQAVRNPFWFSQTEAPAEDEAKADSAPSNPTDVASGARRVLKQRWDTVIEAFAKLDVDAVEAEVVWGDEVKTRLEALYHHRAILYVDVLKYIFSLEPRFSHVAGSDMSSVRRTVFGSGDENDEYAVKLEAIVKEIKQHVGPHLKP